jgi:hypothetical protein
LSGEARKDRELGAMREIGQFEPGVQSWKAERELLLKIREKDSKALGQSDSELKADCQSLSRAVQRTLFALLPQELQSEKPPVLTTATQHGLSLRNASKRTEKPDWRHFTAILALSLLRVSTQKPRIVCLKIS